MASEGQQHPRGRDDDLDSVYSDDVQFGNLVTGTIEEQNAAREACDDGDNDSDVSGSVVTSAESCFDVASDVILCILSPETILTCQASEPQPADSKLGITRQRETGFVFGGDIDISAATDPAEDSDGNPGLDPEAGPDVDPDPPSNPASSPEQEDSQTEGPPDSPAFLVNWVRAPRDYHIEEMPGFLHFDIQNGRRVAIFDERTWNEGFTRGMRKHIMKRARRDDDPNE